MLKFLKISNIALITGLELELQGGLTLFTGETGAGKSILVDALGLLLGGRASSEDVRTGEEKAMVEAVFESHAARSIADAHGTSADGEEVLLRREVLAAGKGRASLNG